MTKIESPCYYCGDPSCIYYEGMLLCADCYEEEAHGESHPEEPYFYEG